jgi:hypothetical protein
MTTAKPKGLEGRCFVIWEEAEGYDRTVPAYQGQVISHLGEGYYLCQYFDAAMGEPGTMAIYHIGSMLEDHRKAGGFTFFEDNKHLRHWGETVAKYIWERRKAKI